MTQDKTIPHFSSNRDDSDDWYELGYNDGLSGDETNRPSPYAKQSKINAYELGYRAGELIVRLK